MELFLENMSGYRKIKRFVKKFILHHKIIFQKPNQPAFYTKDLFWDKPYQIGEFTYGRPQIFDWGEGANLTIGKFCSIAEGVKIFLGGNHRIDWISTYPFNVLNKDFPTAINIKGHPVSKGDVIIGNDVWIGYGATILSGVIIGSGAVIGANAVVTKNVSPYSIIVGNPSKEIKKRFSEEIIELLIGISWWDWPIEKIQNNLHLLCSNNVEELSLQYGNNLKNDQSNK